MPTVAKTRTQHLRPLLDVLTYRASTGRLAVSSVPLTPQDVAHLSVLLESWMSDRLGGDDELLEVSVSAG